LRYSEIMPMLLHWQNFICWIAITF